MSYEIEYKSLIYCDADGELSEPDYIHIVQEGSNNVFDANSGKRSRDFYFLNYGWAYQIIQAICRRAGYCEGGSLTLNGRNTTPENYLKRGRLLLKHARPISEFFSAGFKGHIYLKKELAGDYEKGLLKEVRKTQEIKKDYYGDEYIIISLTDKQHLKTFLKYRCLDKYKPQTLTGGYGVF